MEQSKKNKIAAVGLVAVDTLLLFLYQFVSICFKVSFQRNMLWDFCLHMLDTVVIFRYYFVLKSLLFRKRTKFSFLVELLCMIAIWLVFCFIMETIVRHIGYFDIIFVQAN